MKVCSLPNVLPQYNSPLCTSTIIERCQFSNNSIIGFISEVFWGSFGVLKALLAFSLGIAYNPVQNTNFNKDENLHGAALKVHYGILHGFWRNFLSQIVGISS